jgi:hypothetical protein
MLGRGQLYGKGVCITVFDGSPGGTAATVHYAGEKGLKIIPLWR